MLKRDGDEEEDKLAEVLENDGNIVDTNEMFK